MNERGTWLYGMTLVSNSIPKRIESIELHYLTGSNIRDGHPFEQFKFLLVIMNFSKAVSLLTVQLNVTSLLHCNRALRAFAVVTYTAVSV